MITFNLNSTKIRILGRIREPTFNTITAIKSSYEAPLTTLKLNHYNYTHTHTYQLWEENKVKCNRNNKALYYLITCKRSSLKENYRDNFNEQLRYENNFI